jgi:hypothetical protein
MLKKASWICRHYDSSTYELSDILPFSGDGIRDACSMEACLVGHWEENRIMNIAQSSRAELELANWEEDEKTSQARQNPGPSVKILPPPSSNPPTKPTICVKRF